MSCRRAGLEILEYEPECAKKFRMALVTYFEKKVNLDDPSNETNILRFF